jgi:hypothetical protein
MSGGSENEREDLNAIGNPETVYRSEEGGLHSEGPIGQVRPTGILSRGTPDGALWNSRTGAWRGRGSEERLRKLPGRPNR